MSDDRLEILWQERQIRGVMTRFGAALDGHDWDGYRRCLADRLTVDYSDATGLPPTEVDADDWVAFVRACVEPLATVHRYTNYAIELDGDTAHARFAHVSRHRRPNRQGADQHTQYGTYEVAFACDGEDWLIARLRHRAEWCDGNPAVVDSTTPAWRAAAERVFGAMG